MKKILLSALVFASLSYAASDEQIKEFFSSQLPADVNFKIVSKKQLGNGFEQINFQMSRGELKQSDIIFVNGDFFSSDLISLKDGSSLKEEALKKLASQSIAPLFATEDSAYIISVGSDKNKPTQLIFTDPECPFCRAELARIEQELEHKNIKMILTPVHQKSALQKSWLIYQEIKNAKTDAQKIEIMRKYYAPNAKVDESKVSDADVEKMEKLRQKYFSAGVRSVPYKVEI